MKTILAVLAASAALLAPSVASASPVCAQHNYGGHLYQVTSPDQPCSLVKQVIHQNAAGSIFVRPTNGWAFSSQSINGVRWTGVYVRNGVYMTIVGQYVS